ncbi:MAG: hypothetical protein K6G23_02295, partial [Lachnospiraceae bacterium]|nr:hypothetical protein [Lachnospiraceae bacterium]
MKISLDGSFRVTTAEGIDQIMTLPGTLDEAGIGHPDRIDKPWHPDLQENSAKAEKVKAKAAAADHEAFARDSRIPSRLTRVVTYEGAVHFTSALPTLPTGGRLFLIAERARALTLQINGTKIPCRSGSLSTPYCFELTGLAKSGDEITLTTDNTYPALPYQDIVFSSAATDESQTNWNGIVGELYLEQTPDTFIDRVLVYPHRNHIDVTVRIDAKEACAQELTLRLTSPALSAPAQMQVSLSAGQNCVTFTDLALTR